MDRIEAAISKIEEKGMTILAWISREYPALLREIAAPPPILYVKGATIPSGRGSKYCRCRDEKGTVKMDLEISAALRATWQAAV